MTTPLQARRRLALRARAVGGAPPPPPSPSVRYVAWSVQVQEVPPLPAALRGSRRALYLGSDVAFRVTLRAFDTTVDRVMPVAADAALAARVAAYMAARPGDAVGVALAPRTEVRALASGELLVRWEATALAPLAARVGQRVWRVLEDPGNWRVADALIVHDDRPAGG